MLKVPAVLIFNDSTEREIKPRNKQYFTDEELFMYLGTKTISTISSFDKKATMVIDVEAWSAPKKPKNIRASLYALDSAQNDGIRGNAIIIYDQSLLVHQHQNTEPDDNVQIDQQIYDQR